ncbi:MAG: polysaccharide biosynthesis tyrosine autokinase [candidate division WS1 bacterium]|nr:polysaccharide biosynthesis tyrosine autokinase [candidate division WS1 bacterium]
METASSRFGIRDYQRILARRWWFILTISVCSGIIGVFIVLGMPKTFRAVATIVVPEQSRGVLLLGGQRESGQNIALETQALIAQGNQTALRTAKALAERTTGAPIIVDPSNITDALRTTVKLPDLLRIEATSEDPVKAREFANQTALSFLQIMDELRQKQHTNAQRYLETQMERTRAELQTLINERQRFLKESGLRTVTVGESAGDSGQPGGSFSPIMQEPDMRPALRTAQADLATAQGRLSALRKQHAQLKGVEPERAVVPNPAHAALQQELSTAQAALVQLRARYTDEHPSVQEMKLRVQEAQTALRRSPSTMATMVAPDQTERNEVEASLRQAEREVANLQARVARLNGLVALADATWSAALDKEGYLEQLQDQISLKRAAYQELLTQLEAKKLTVASERGRESMVDSALGARSTAPTVSRTLVFALALGLFLGFAMALLLEALDDTIRLPEDLTRDSDVRFLGIVPFSADHPELVMIDAPKSPPAEAFRTLRSNMRFSALDQPTRLLLVTSAGAGEGKSTVVANLAAACAQAGESVIVIDADMRRPSLHKLYEADASRGLTNVLMGELSLEQALQSTLVPNLRFLPSGPLPPNPAELIDSTRMSELLTEASKLADLVILDSPPAIMLTDALLLAGQVDQTLIVAAAGQVTRDAYNEVVRLLTHARGNILGVLLNKLKLTTGDYYYYYYYYYYYEGGQPGGKRGLPRPVPRSSTGSPAEAAKPPDDTDLPF